MGRSSQVRAKVENNLMGLSGVSGVSHTNDDKVILYVQSEKYIRAMPKALGGVPVETKVIGKLVAFKDRTSRFRPIIGGASCGNPKITAGTIGVVSRNEKLLSNSHVLALGCDGFCEKGTAVWQPGDYDGGDSDDKVAELENYVDIKFNDKKANNHADAAIASVTVDSKKMTVLGKDNESDYTIGESDTPVVALLFAGSGKVTVVTPIKYVTNNLNVDLGNTAEVSKGETVVKSGRTSGWKENTVKDTGVSIKVCYNRACDEWAVFRDQILVNNPFGAPGDSGSITFCPPPSPTPSPTPPPETPSPSPSPTPTPGLRYCILPRVIRGEMAPRVEQGELAPRVACVLKQRKKS